MSVRLWLGGLRTQHEQAADIEHAGAEHDRVDDHETGQGRLHRDGGSQALASQRGAWDTFYPAFAEAVRGAAPMPVDPWDAVATAIVLDAARESARTARVIAVEPLKR